MARAQQRQGRQQVKCNTKMKEKGNVRQTSDLDKNERAVIRWKTQLQFKSSREATVMSRHRSCYSPTIVAPRRLLSTNHWYLI